MKSNGLLKWLVIPVLVLAVWGLIKTWTAHRASHAASSAASDTLTPAELKALGIEGDTPHDTVATLVGQVKALRGEIQATVNDNQAQRAENERLHQRESDIDQRIQNAVNAERDRLHDERDQAQSDKQQTQGLLQDLERRLDTLDHKSGADLPVGLGLREGDDAGFAGGGMQWTEPADKTPQGTKRNGATPTASTTPVGGFGSADTAPAQQTLPSNGTTNPDDAATDKPHLRPVYTVPANATLIGSVAMTALIGRVPVDGTVNDPYPFKVLIGPDNLTANGIDLPDVAGAVVSGSASGDWTLSCVRGQIRSITFVFRDGTIRTLPANDRASNSDASTNTNNTANGTATTQGGLGWISDPYGIPCVAGERRSNAEQYLGSQALITAAGAGAASLIPKGSDNVSYVSSNGNTLGTVGISANEAMGRILAGGVQEMSQWVNKLYGQAFAAIYVKPGARVAVHIDQPLTLDYDPKGRKVNYHTGGSHASDLD
ncbi:integrating conjugative element protein, PFL_4705 family [Burkholderia pseudomallei]|uniref:TIGR03752 family integrating conjugative element protein n=1 Tax=Burkholderia pseudomallei TaxID=28450 RepID=UPI000F051F2E|nr:TIGR03752 family integrating conjugative element protein [Burkholderia pseudomallei]CAJ2751903.1 integrating conjugative element protein, PFL_4705 family [Burkholderia pseudomallei]VCJ93133.1 integrating conjugative element protein, PFL_4705 family [Burkholderia pseudomallei]VCJ95081.1 integrating conjugative element protein, PFL_4705 family [Burkholderia pseudomallei]VCJ95613.1 integrating conjugative element protein, PFL_4705 family [Burkholderia pseudomallei]VCJ97648.1 integrating conjug